MPLLDQVEQPAGRRDDDVDAALQRSHLRPLRDAPEDRGDRELQPGAVGDEALRNLARELARRGEHQHPRPAGDAGRAGVREPFENRQREGRGLAGAGLRDAAEIASGEDRGDGLLLDRGRSGMAFNGNGAKDGFAKGEIGELVQRILSLCQSLADGRIMRRLLPKRCRKTTRAKWAVWLRANEDRGRVSFGETLSRCPGRAPSTALPLTDAHMGGKTLKVN